MTDSNLAKKCQNTFDFAARQLRHLAKTYPHYFPMYTVNGRHWDKEWLSETP